MATDPFATAVAPTDPFAAAPSGADPIDKYAPQYGVDPHYARQILGIETGGEKNPNTATSSSGARGRFQLMPGTFAEQGVGSDITDPDQNTHAGIKYLAAQLKKYGGDKAKAAGAYNAGPGAFDEYLAGKRKLTPETIAYMAHFGSPPHDTREADFSNQSHPKAVDPFATHDTREADFRNRGNVPVDPFATHDTREADFRNHSSAPTPGRVSDGMPTALQAQLANKPRGDTTQGVQVSSGARSAASDVFTKAIDYTALPALPAALVARDVHFQHQQRKKLTGQALKDFNAKVDSGSTDPDVRPNEAHFYKTFTADELKPANVHKLVEQMSMTGDGPGSFMGVVDTAVGLGKGKSHGVQPTETYGGAPLALQTQLAGHSKPKDEPSQVGRAVSASKPALVAAADMAVQGVNPLGAVVRTVAVPLRALTTAAKASTIATKTIPAIIDKIGSTETGAKLLKNVAGLEQGVSPFAGLRRAAMKNGMDPDSAEQAGRSFVNAGSVAKANATHVVEKLYGGLTPAQRVEVERLSEGLTPKLPDPNGDLARRAADVRHTYTTMTQDQVALELMKPARIFDTTQYTYRGGGVYQRGAIPPELQDFFDTYRSGTMRPGAISGQKNAHKSFANYDEAEPYLDHSKYDPADQMLTYLAKRGTDVGRERAIRDLHGMGLVNDLAVMDPKTNAVMGFGKAGAEAAEKVASRNAKLISSREAFDTLNKQRIARGDAAITWVDFAQMQRAVASKGKLRNRGQEAERAAQEADRLAGRAQTGATKTEQRAGDVLKQQLDQRVRDLDAFNEKIAKLHDKALEGDRAAAAKSLAQAVAQRDKMALEIDKMRENVQTEAEGVYGRRPANEYREKADADRYFKIVDKYGPGSPEANAVFKEISERAEAEAKAETRAGPQPKQSQIYEPVVGHLQDAYKLAQQLPPGPARAALLRKLGAIGNRGVKGPTRIADRVQAEKLLRKVQNAMSAVAEAGRDTTSLRLIAQLEKTSQSLERGIARDDSKLYAKRSQVADPAQRAADAVFAGSAKARKRADHLLNAYDFARASESDVRAFETAFNRAMAGRTTSETERILDLSKRQAANRIGEAPFVDRGGDSSIGSPTLKFATARPEVVRFFQSQGAPTIDAHGAAAFIDGMNRLTRMGIITNPVVHAGWNLGTHYLAAGGSPEFFISRAWTDPHQWGQLGAHTGAEWLAMAEDNNAVVHMADTHPIFGGSYARNVLDKPGDHGPRQAMNAATTQLWMQNQRIVFNDFETRYSVDLFRKFVEQGMTPQKAGIQVRKALGDYTNVSRSGIDGSLRKMLLFYPWMKTAIPFWVKTLITKPQFVTIPGIGIRRWDQQMGDPDVGSESPFTIDLGGEEGGGRRKMSYPGPQKWVGDILNFLQPKNADVDPIGARLDAAEKLANTHLMPWGGASVEGAVAFGAPIAETFLEGQRAREPGEGNFTTLANREAPRATQAGQIAQFYGQKLPGAGLAQGAVKSVQDLAQGKLTGLAGVAGGFQYDRLPKSAQHRLNSINSALDRAMKHASATKSETARASIIKHAQTRYEHDMKRFKAAHDGHAHSTTADPFAAAPTDPFAVGK